jgi:uncharacterized SAM-binding protein YcdF (DUF218 family)
MRSSFESGGLLKELSKPKRRRSVTLFVLGSIAVLLAAIQFFREFEAIESTPVHTWVLDQSADCAVVLTGGSGRVKEGMDLLARRSIRKLIISGVNPQAEWRDIFPNWPFYQDVHELDIVLERRSRTTFGNAQQSLAVAEALGCRDLLVITSHVHLPRALRTFRAEFEGRMHVEGRAVQGGPVDSGSFEVAVEVLKSFFYGLWAY